MALEAVISSFYAAAAGRLSWDQALNALAAQLDMWCAQIVGVDKRTGRLLLSAWGGTINPAAMLDYVRDYHAINPRLAPAIATPEDQWMHDHEHLDEAFVAKDRFYQEFLIPYGGRYMSATKLAQDDDVAFMIGLIGAFGQRPLTERGDRQTLALVKHHLSEAVRNYLHLRHTYAEVGIARHLLGQFAYPMLLVDDARGIWHRNAAAVQLLASGAVLRDRAGLLTCAEPRYDDAFGAALRGLGLDARHPEAPHRRRVLRIGAANGPRHLALLSAILPHQSGGAFGTTPLALVIVHAPGHRRTEPDPLIIGDCFDLTPAEARVVAQLAAGDDAKAIARRHGTALETVRTQIQRAMEKMGVHRQIDLVRMVLELP
jgi:DNA-binding CsgD family transcriptional regulator